MGVNEIDFANLNASRGLGQGLALGTRMGRVHRDNRLQDEELERKEAQRGIDDAARDAAIALQIEDPQERDAFLAQRQARIESMGNDSTDTARLRGLPANEQNNELKHVLAKALPVSSLAGVDGKNKAQFGGQELFKDEAGNLFYGTSVRNPSTGGVEPVLTPVLGGDAKPQGNVSMVNSIGLTPEEKVAQAAAEERAKTEAKNSTDLVGLPKIRAAIAEAEAAAKSKGETLSDYKRAKVSMAGLQETISTLKSLAPIATHTYTGRGFDLVAKELGFGATKGSTARAKYVAIVSNQVLPLLKQTFGAAFTAKEGEKLEATMGDANAAPQEKIAQLEAFIEQKMRDLETKGQLVIEQQTNSVDDLVNMYGN